MKSFPTFIMHLLWQCFQHYYLLICHLLTFTCQGKRCDINLHKHLKKLDLEHFIPPVNGFHSSFITSEVSNHTMYVYIQQQKTDLQRPTRKTGPGGIKLRLYRTFKTHFETEPYVKSSMSKQHRCALARMRCEVAPLKLETGRYENIPLELRTCTNMVEDEKHVLLACPLYTQLQHSKMC